MKTAAPVTCPSPLCPMCNGTRCHACGQPDFSRMPGCPHGATERHGGSLAAPTPLVPRTMTQPKFRPATLPPPEPEETIISRTPTKPIEPSPGMVYQFDLADGHKVAEFFELMAKVARTMGRVRITID